jgi:hypothetical protein
MQKQAGKFVISLDFEIIWGVRSNESKALDAYRSNLLGVQTVIPRTISLFERYNICCTFATVGLLFFSDKKELLSGLPEKNPQYTNSRLSPYGSYLDAVGENATVDPYHFAPHLIELIRNSPRQEIGTHTFSHYFCLERGQDIDDFREDIKAAVAVAEKKGITLTSIVFPRNQFNKAYLKVCSEAGIIAYRNNENSWLYTGRNSEEESLFRRSLRLLDSYINITGHHCYSDEYMIAPFPVNIPSSRFLRPYSSKLKALDWLRLRRIKKAMTHAAKNGLMYHLWWHPHNFGINQEANFSFLEKILQHYQYLNEQYGFISITMTDLAYQLQQAHAK